MASTPPSPRLAASVAGSDIDAEIASAESVMNPEAVRTALGALESAFGQRTAAALARAGPAPGLPIDIDAEEDKAPEEPTPGSEEWSKRIADKILELQRMLASHGTPAGGKPKIATIDTPTRIEPQEPQEPPEPQHHSLPAFKSPFGICNSSDSGQPAPAPNVGEDPLRGSADPWGNGAKTSPKPDFMALYLKQM